MDRKASERPGSRSRSRGSQQPHLRSVRSTLDRKGEPMSSRNALKRVTVALATCLCVQSAFGNDWIDWTSGSTQSFTNSSGASGTVTYTYTLQSVYASSENSPDTNFPFGN